MQGLGSQLVTRLSEFARAAAQRGLRVPFRAATPTFRNMSTSRSYGHLTYYDGPLVWIDCEMTGLDYKTDRILEIAVSAFASRVVFPVFISWITGDHH